MPPPAGAAAGTPATRVGAWWYRDRLLSLGHSTYGRLPHDTRRDGCHKWLLAATDSEHVALTLETRRLTLGRATPPVVIRITPIATGTGTRASNQFRDSRFRSGSGRTMGRTLLQVHVAVARAPVPAWWV